MVGHKTKLVNRRMCALTLFTAYIVTNSLTNLLYAIMHACMHVPQNLRSKSEAPEEAN